MRTYLTTCLAAFATLVVAACAGGSDTGDTCAPGDTTSCTCASGAVGQRTCKDDGSGWGGCVCADLPDTVGPDATDDTVEVVDVAPDTTPGKGALEAILHDGTDGAFVFSSIVVRLVPGTTACSSLAPAATPPGVLAQQTLAATGTSATFQSLLTSKTYTIVATGKGPNGHLAGWGCADAVALTANQTTQQSVVLELQPLDTANCFSTTVELAFGGSAQSIATGVRDAAANAFLAADDDLRQGITQRLYDAHQADWGSQAQILRQGFDDELAEAIPAWVAAHPRTWLECYLDLDDELATVAATVSAGVRVRLPAVTAGALTAEETWQSVTVFWEGACQAGGLCQGVAAVAGCTKQGSRCGCALPLADVAVGVDASFQGTVSEWDQLALASHPVPLKHGRLARRLIPLFLKGASGGQLADLTAAFASLWDCQALAQAIDPNVRSIAGVEAAEVVTHCQATAAALAAALATAIEPEADETLSLEGAATLLDANDDLKVDRLQEGTLSGEISWDATVRGTFEGTFSGGAVACPN